MRLSGRFSGSAPVSDTFFSKGLDYFTEFDALKAENEQLKQQISDNAQLVRDAQIALEENNQLRSQLGQPENTRTTTTVSAEVIARSPGDWADTLTLDKGSSSGVNKDDLVTTVDGMLGFVSEVTDNTCEVTSITDPKIAVRRACHPHARDRHCGGRL